MRQGFYDTQPSDIREVILTRECKVEFEGKVGPLVLSVMRPEKLNGEPQEFDENVRGRLRLACEYFDQTLTLNGGDDLMVIAWLMTVGKACLHGKRADGFDFWLYDKGDFDFFDFWSYKQKPSEYCLPSAFQDAALDAFIKETEGQSLMPSHRVAIELDRPGVTTYDVQPDGSDRLAGFLGPDQIKGISPNELARRLGLMVLRGSEEGRELLQRREAAADYPTNARSST